MLKKTQSKGENFVRVIYRKGIDHFYAKGDCYSLASEDRDFWDRQKIRAREYCPSYPGNLIRAPDPTPINGYVKYPKYEFDQGHRNHSDMRYLKERFMREVRACEWIRQCSPESSHLAAYYGVLVKEGLIRGISYAGYDSNLEDCVNPNGHSKRTFQYGQYQLPRMTNRRLLIDQIHKGVKHLHSLGLIHNDLKPSNICLTQRDGTAVIIDFDSCVQEGESLDRVGRTDGWHDPRVGVAQRSNDLDAVYEIKEWISDNRAKQYRFAF